MEDPFDKEVIERIRLRNAEGDTAKNRYRNIDQIESILKKFDSRVRRFFRLPTYLFLGAKAASGTYKKNGRRMVYNH
jgi:hypothetical protein